MMSRTPTLSLRRPGTCAALFLALALVAVACTKDDPTLEPADNPRLKAPPPPLRELGHTETRNVFWGDLHIHSSHSFDAYTLGVRALPEEVYVYAKGGTIEHALGYPIRAWRPLDFASVTDHAEFLGAARARDEAEGDTELSLREIMQTGNPLRITANFLYTILTKMGSSETRREAFGGGATDVSRSAWEDIIATAERHNEPGRFTAFLGYEWTSMPQEKNLHRNIIYRSAQVPDFPVSSLDSDNPEDLWRALEEQRRQGMEMIAIPHNGNVSGGKMYDRVQFDGSPLSENYAATRMRNEPISEIFQVKGSSETHPQLSDKDEFAGFEILDQLLSASGAFSEPRGSYARDALRSGLEMSSRRGFNPYRFGVIGSSDSHNASSSVEEDNYHGKLPMIDGTSGLRLGETMLLPASQNRARRWSAAGLAAVWAEENTRASLFDAMRRKETYATSGPRITLRFFASRDFPAGILDDPRQVEKALARGVPMGGELPPGEATPSFLVTALKDPLGANLDRIQIIKGWVDGKGQSFERIYDIQASGGRVPDATTHRVGPVGNTVNETEASFTNTIGAAALKALWRDPDYIAGQEAFYYARVLEIPTPRWSTYDARDWGIDAPTPTSIQERAVSSAIWLQARSAPRAG
ncbi:MAG: DUF3604 domain-containing protein [Deltaproteobacteria bacterium]